MGAVVPRGRAVRRARDRVADHGLQIGELATQFQRRVPRDGIADLEVLDGVGDRRAIKLAQRLQYLG